MDMDDTKRLELIVEAVRYCQRVATMGMPSSAYTKALREPIYFLWACRFGSNKISRAQFRSKAAIGLKYGKRELVGDHAIPFGYQQAALLELPEVSTDAVRRILDSNFGVGVLITSQENERLNRAKLKNKMPADWDRVEVLARYKAVGIEVVENELWHGNCAA